MKSPGNQLLCIKGLCDQPDEFNKETQAWIAEREELILAPQTDGRAYRRCANLLDFERKCYRLISPVLQNLK